MNSTQFDEFAFKTRSQLQIYGCKYLKTVDCSPKNKNEITKAEMTARNDENPWKMIHTPFGYCHTLNPSIQYPALRERNFAYGRQARLD